MGASHVDVIVLLRNVVGTKTRVAITRTLFNGFLQSYLMISSFCLEVNYIFYSWVGLVGNYIFYLKVKFLLLKLGI